MARFSEFILLVGLFALAGVARADAPAWYTDPRMNWEDPHHRLFSPLEYQAQITSHYGPRHPPLAGATEWHKAIDLAAKEGTPVFAAYPGVVVASSDSRGGDFPWQLKFLQSRANPTWKSAAPGPFDRGCGNFVIEGIVPHWDASKGEASRRNSSEWDWGGFILYCHLSKVVASDWHAVRVQDQLAESGRTGAVTGPHLHIGIFLEPRYLPADLKAICGRGPDGGPFAQTCSVNPQRFLFQRSTLAR